MNHYATLGLDKLATQAEIKLAYRRLASIHHPDKGGNAAVFQQIQIAYQHLQTYSQPDIIDIRVNITLQQSYNAEYIDAYTANNIYNIKVPQGVDTGETAEYKLSEKNILRVTYFINNHPWFKRTGLDLTYTAEVNIFHLITGNNISIPTLNDKYTVLSISPGTQPDSVITIPNAGIKKNNQNGDLKVLIKAVIPDRISQELRNHINQEFPVAKGYNIL